MKDLYDEAADVSGSIDVGRNDHFTSMSLREDMPDLISIRAVSEIERLLRFAIFFMAALSVAGRINPRNSLPFMLIK